MADADDTFSDQPSIDPLPSDPVAAIVTDVDADARRLADLRERVYTTLLKRSTIEPQLAWALLLGGAFIILAVSAILAFVITIISLPLYDGEGPSFRFWFWLFVLAFVPLILWEERRSRSGFFTLAQPDVDLTRDRDNLGEYLLERSKSNARAIVDGLLWAPRAMVAGFRAIRGTRSPGLDLVLPEAADLLTLMITLDGGVKIKDLVPPGEDPMQLMPTLKWLDAHDYIGTSTRGDRVWVSTFARKRLAADHGDKIAFKPRPKAR